MTASSTQHRSAVVAVLPCRAGVLAPGSAATVELVLDLADSVSGQFWVVGDGAVEAARALRTALPLLVRLRRSSVTRMAIGACPLPPGLQPGGLAAALAATLASALAVNPAGRLDATDCIVLPASADGRDLAPRLAAELDRPLLARAVALRRDGAGWWARLARLDDRVGLEVDVMSPVVVTLAGHFAALPEVSATVDGDAAAETALADEANPLEVIHLVLPQRRDPQVVAVVEPAPETAELADAGRVLAGGAGLVRPGTPPDVAAEVFTLLTSVATALGASVGATRVATDAGWIGSDRQIGTTGVALSAQLYVAVGISGASQHTGGLGAPQTVVSVNTDPACPMTELAGLGLVTDAVGLLIALADRLGVTVPPRVRSLDTSAHPGSSVRVAPQTDQWQGVAR